MSGSVRILLEGVTDLEAVGRLVGEAAHATVSCSWTVDDAPGSLGDVTFADLLGRRRRVAACVAPAGTVEGARDGTVLRMAGDDGGEAVLGAVLDVTGGWRSRDGGAWEAVAATREPEAAPLFRSGVVATAEEARTVCAILRDRDRRAALEVEIAARHAPGTWDMPIAPDLDLCVETVARVLAPDWFRGEEGEELPISSSPGHTAIHREGARRTARRVMAALARQARDAS